MTWVYTVNAFSSCPDGGNPAGVVLDAADLSDAQMQAIAAHVGFSETAFVFPSVLADFHVRFFTPSHEVDLCGHASIATFHLLREQGRVQPGHYRQETKAGVLSMEIATDGSVLMTQGVPVFSEFPDPEPIVRSLNLGAEGLHPVLRPQIVSTGLRDILVPIGDLQTLWAIQPDFDAVCEVCRQWDAVGYHLFSLETLHGATAHCRNLAPLYGIPEESATGTANGALSAYLYRHGAIDAGQAESLVFEQGDCMGKPSEIRGRLLIEGDQILRVQIGGNALTMGGIEIEASSFSEK